MIVQVGGTACRLVLFEWDADYTAVDLDCYRVGIVEGAQEQIDGYDTEHYWKSGTGPVGFLLSPYAGNNNPVIHTFDVESLEYVTFMCGDLESANSIIQIQFFS